MLNKKFKLYLILVLVLSLIFSFSLINVKATDEAVVTSEDPEASESLDTPSTEQSVETEEQQPTLEEISGDLYLSGIQVNMDKAVDGNVFIIGKNVKITGQVNGNLFVLADTVNFDKSYVASVSYVCANDVYYNGYTNDLYVACDDLEMTYESYVFRDVKAMSSNAIIKTCIGRDFDLVASKIDFGEEALSTGEENTNSSEVDVSSKEVPLIYRNLRYNSKTELNLIDGIVQGDITHNKKLSINLLSSNIFIDFIIAIITVTVVYLLLNKFIPKYDNKLEKQTLIQALIALGIGLLTCIAVCLVSIILIIIKIGIILGIVLLSILLLLAILSTSIVVIFISKKIFTLLKLSKNYYMYIILAVVAIILSALGLIPYVGIVISIIIKLCGIGLILYTPFSKK